MVVVTKTRARARPYRIARPAMAVLGWQFKWQCDDLTNVANST
jgi:hypothetical protein